MSKSTTNSTRIIGSDYEAVKTKFAKLQKDWEGTAIFFAGNAILDGKPVRINAHTYVCALEDDGFFLETTEGDEIKLEVATRTTASATVLVSGKLDKTKGLFTFIRVGENGTKLPFFPVEKVEPVTEPVKPEPVKQNKPKAKAKDVKIALCESAIRVAASQLTEEGADVESIGAEIKRLKNMLKQLKTEAEAPVETVAEAPIEAVAEAPKAKRTRKSKKAAETPVVEAETPVVDDWYAEAPVRMASSVVISPPNGGFYDDLDTPIEAPVAEVPKKRKNTRKSRKAA